MPYGQKVSCANPAAIVMVLDDSGSMQECLSGTSDPKHLWCERYFWVIAKELLARSTETQGADLTVKPRYYLHVIKYGSMPQPWAPEIQDIQAAVTKYTNEGNTLGLGGKLGGTDAAAALQLAYEHLQIIVNDPRFQRSFPPMVFHLTDGMSHSDPTVAAGLIKSLATADGNVLLVNAFIGTQTNLNYKEPEDFPGYVAVSEVGPHEDNIRLFNMSSEMPACIHRNLVDDGIFPAMRAGARLFFDVRTKDMLKHVIQVVSSIGADRTQR